MNRAQTRRTLLVLTLALAQLYLPRSAHADAYDAALTRAIAEKERALDVNDPARWEETLRLLQEADALRSTRECKYELGFAAERLKRTDLAVEHYEAALDLGLIGAPRSKAEAFVGEHAAALARLTVRGPPGVRLRVAGIDRGRLPLPRPLVLFAGEVRLETTYGGQRVVRTVTLTSGQLDVLDLALAPAPLAPEPLALPPPPPESPPAPPPAVHPEPPRPMPRSSPATPTTRWGWTLVGTGLGVGIGAAVLGGVAIQLKNQRESDLSTYDCTKLNGPDACTTPATNQRDAAQAAVNDIATWKAVSAGAWVGVGVGAATAVTGAVLLAIAPPPSGRHAAPAVAQWLPRASFERSGVSLVWGEAF
jgi:hypothetical protein